MNLVLWIIQILIALHTLMGAIWKFSNSEQTVAPLKAIPHTLWQLLSVVEILCVLALLIPVIWKRLGYLVPVAAGIIAAEMILFSVVLLRSGEQDHSPMIYWLVVAAICIFLAFGRRALHPIK